MLKGRARLRDALMLQCFLSLFAVEMRNVLMVVRCVVPAELPGQINGARPVFLNAIYCEQTAVLIRRLCARLQTRQRFFGTIQTPCLQEILSQFIKRVIPLGQRQVSAAEQILMNADRAPGLATAAEQVTKREMKFGGF